MIEKILGDLRISFDDGVRYSEYSCEWYDVLTVYDDEGFYEIINNYFMGHRLYIRKIDGSWKDIPFRESSFEIVPFIKVERIYEK